MTKNIESSRIQTLIPQQLINDSTALVEFLKEYYKFVNQEQEPTNVINTIIKNKDLDLALDKYISLIEKEIGYGMVTNMVANKLNVYKNIEEFYDTKGSIESFKLLFRILFNVNVEIELPKEQILIASDGKWKQDNSIFSITLSGNPFSLVNNSIDIINPDGEIISVEVLRVRSVESNVYEIFIDQSFRGNIDVNATINTLEYSGQIINSLNSFKILSSGKNFKVGQFLEIINDRNANSTSIIKITQVDSEGGLVNFEFIKFGYEYDSDFKSYLYPVEFNGDFESSPSDFGFPLADKLGRVSELLKTNEHLTIELNPYSLNYFSQDYVDGIRTAGNFDAVYNQDQIEFEEINQQLFEENVEENNIFSRALVEFKLTPLSKYKGYYSNNNGFLSDNIKLQDNFYYQAFSYVLKSNQPFEKYKNIVRKTVHPSGMALFGQYEITNNFDVATRIQLLERFYSERLSDSVDTSEFVAKLIIKPLVDSVLTSEFWYYDYNKPIENNVSLISYIEEKIFEKSLTNNISAFDVLEDILFNKNIFDTIITSEEVDVVLNRRLFDSVGIFDGGTTETVDIYATSYFGQDYSEGIEQLGAVKQFNKVLNSHITISEEIDTFSVGKGQISSSTTISSNVESFIINKNLNNSITTLDSINAFNISKAIQNSINTSDSGLIEFNPYSVNYFAQDYVEGQTSF